MLHILIIIAACSSLIGRVHVSSDLGKVHQLVWNVGGCSLAEVRNPKMDILPVATQPQFYSPVFFRGDRWWETTAKDGSVNDH